MKKFTIFLLTFLLFVGFINVNAQNRSGDGGPMRGTPGGGIVTSVNSALYCKNGPVPIPSPVRVTFTVLTLEGNPNPTVPELTNRVIHYRYDGPGNPWQTDTIRDGDPGDVQFGVFFKDLNLLAATDSVEIWASYEYPAGTTYSSDEIFTIYILQTPPVAIVPHDFFLMCEGTNATLLASSEEIPALSNLNPKLTATWKYTHDGVIDTQITNPYTLGDEVPYTFQDAGLGLHKFKFSLTVRDVLDNPSPTCDAADSVEFTVVPQPEVLLTTQYPAICSTIPTFELYTYVSFDPPHGGCAYQRVFTLWNDEGEQVGDIITDTITPGVIYNDPVFTINTSSLHACDNVFSIMLELENLDSCDGKELNHFPLCYNFDEITVTKFEPIQADAGEDAGMCGNGKIELNATLPDNVEDCDDIRGTWRIDAYAGNPYGVVLTDEHNPNMEVTFSGVNDIHPYRFIWKLENGSCEDEDTVLIVVMEKPDIKITSTGLTMGVVG